MTKYWSYNGSLTTPDCREGIKWTVIEEVQNISKEQLKVFTDLINAKTDDKGNFRNVQQLNQRTLYYSGATHLLAGVATAIAATALLTF